jgi:hypothetical protein
VVCLAVTLARARGHDGRFPAGEVGGFYAAGVAGGGEGARLVWADKGDVDVRLDLLLHPDGPEDAVDDQAAVVVVEDVLGGPLGGVEDPVR